MKILFLNNLLPYPLDNGGKIKTYNTLKALSRHHQVDLLAFVNSKNERAYIRHLSAVSRQIDVVCKTVIKDTSKLAFVKDYLFSTFSSLPYVVKKFYTNEMKNKIVRFQRENQYDLIYVNHLSMMAYHNCFETKVVLDQQNVESLIFGRFIAQTKNPLKKGLGYIEFIKLKKFEKDMLRRADRIIALSEADKQAFTRMLGRDKKEIAVISIHIDEKMLQFSPPEQNKIRLLFMGTMSWYPNKNGMLWFLENCLPRLDPKKYHLYICGAHPPKELTAYQNKQNVTVTGYVKDMNDYIRKCDIGIVPLFIGSGQRVKIIESFAKGLPVISTAVGAEGLVTDEDNILIADSGEEFLDAIKTLSERPDLREKIKMNARLTYENYYSNASLSEKLDRALPEHAAMQSGQKVL
ncbi:glycosyltransferase family 4 protein [Sporolactobacillus sp. CQH2019]|uniref:glycosyltransferase family 4 protein n=1 Tax=Sporolactobacillus sp. CQH2019 TaxID=3023512 RepID=UPI002367B67D|nr:glycosyltransferase family 4 protein [Sporolactobacillus sp. CQH2019]MDD9149639.1 glycosyltransferase family 4 protein [Sporolactobacillus sp. CQH2019]